MKRYIFLLCALVVLMLGPMGERAYSQARTTGKKATQQVRKSLLEVARATPQLSTFVKAIQAADLTKTLDIAANQQFTVFAPSNAAFDSLPSGAKEDLLKPENKEKLRNLLLNHIVSGNHKAADLENEQTFQSIGGQEIGISHLGGKIMAGGKDVEKSDIAAANGVIHIINVVMVPPVEEADADKP